MMFVVIRLRGNVRVNDSASFALELLRLSNVHNCVVLKDSPDNKGTLVRVKDYTAFGEVSDELLKELVAKRGRKIGGSRLEEKEVGKMLKLLGDNKALLEAGFKPVFRLRPPKKGLKNKKRHYPFGDLGNHGKDINDLLSRMI